MNDQLKNFDDVSRRSFMSMAAKSMLGVSMIPMANAIAAPGGKGSAKNVIYLFMSGAMSHLDSFDLKPGREVQGETKPIRTNVAGMQISEFFPKLSQQMKKLAIIRSMYTETGAHGPGRYLMRTSYKEIATIRHPTMGAWAQHQLGKRNRELPDSVIVAGGGRYPAAGFMETKYTPLPIGDPNKGLQNTKSPSYLGEKQFQKRMLLSSTFDRRFRAKFNQDSVNAYTSIYAQTVRLLKSPQIKAFDINAESPKTKSMYGGNRLGQGCLLARRLVENNVRFVEVEFGGWDNHRDIYSAFPGKAGNVDQAVSALLTDLESKGLLDQTMVVLSTEFGRKPKINQNGGRDHHPGAFSTVLAGGGIRGGRFYGSSDEDGHSADTDPVSVQEFAATIGHGMGLSLTEEVHSKTGRPFKPANGAEPIKALFG